MVKSSHLAVIAASLAHGRAGICGCDDRPKTTNQTTTYPQKKTKIQILEEDLIKKLTDEIEAKKRRVKRIHGEWIWHGI